MCNSIVEILQILEAFINLHEGRVFRNNYKGHMDKTNGGGIRVGDVDGWGGVEWWGENRDNCT